MRRALALLALLSAFLALPACGASWQERGDGLLRISSRGVVVAERIVAAERAAQCPTGDVECLRQHHLDAADHAIAAAKEAIVAGLNGLATAAHDGLEATWNAVAPCVAAAVTSVLSALVDAGVSIPPLVREAAVFVAAILGPCVPLPDTPP